MPYPTTTLMTRRERDVMDRERLAAAALRKKCAKHKGRNHWRNWERRQMALAKKKAAAIQNRIVAAADARFRAASRAYWRGDRDCHP